MGRVALFWVLASIASCYAPSVDCLYSCGTDGPCPDGTSCKDGYCRAPDATGACSGELCGNGLIDPGEDCDDNDDDTDDCAGCKSAMCGDGFVRAGMEQCDDGNDDRSDACVACAWAYCGDEEKRRAVEECEPAEAGCTSGCVPCGASATVWSTSADGHCYALVLPASFFDAKAGCAFVAAHLFTPASDAQRVEVASRLVNSSTGPAWLGLYEPGVGDFEWVTGEPFTPYPGMANVNDAADHCWTLEPGASAPWGDWSCTDVKPALCENEPWKIADPIVDNHAYKVFYTPTDWNNAVSVCGRIVPGKSHLVTIDDARERDFVDSIAFLDIWIDGPGCKVLGAGGSVTDEVCTTMHPVMCELE